jgi:hypothetical protein
VVEVGLQVMFVTLFIFGSCIITGYNTSFRSVHYRLHFLFIAKHYHSCNKLTTQLRGTLCCGSDYTMYKIVRSYGTTRSHDSVTESPNRSSVRPRWLIIHQTSCQSDNQPCQTGSKNRWSGSKRSCKNGPGINGPGKDDPGKYGLRK